MIVFDASAVVSAALRVDSVPEQALLRAEATDLFALSAEVDAEIAEVLGRPRFAKAVTAARRTRILDILRGDAVWFSPTERVTDCRDAKDDKYLELALAAGAGDDRQRRRRPAGATSLARRADTPAGRLPCRGRGRPVMDGARPSPAAGRPPLCPPRPGPVLPALVAAAGERAGTRFLEFFASTIRNPHTRRAYARAVADFLAWCEEHGVPSIAAVQPLHVAAWIEVQTREQSAPTVKQQLAAIRHLFDWLVMGQVDAAQPGRLGARPGAQRAQGQDAGAGPGRGAALLDSIDVARRSGCATGR